MKKRVLGLLLLFTISSLPAFSSTFPKPGANCSKQGITKTYKGKKYKCIKSGQKLVWNKGVAVKTASPQVTPVPSSTPTPTPTPTPTLTLTPSPVPTPTSNQNLKFNPQVSCGGNLAKCPEVTANTKMNANMCKVPVPQNQLLSGGSIGFPRPNYAKVTKTPLEILMVPVSFKDLSFTIPERELAEIITFAKDTYRKTSWGKAKLNFTIVPESSAIKESSTFKEFQDKNNSNLDIITQLLVQRIEYPNLAQYDSIILITPQSNSISWGGGNVGATYDSKYGKVGNVYLSVGGNRLVDLPHLLGHTLYALSDLYISSQAIQEKIPIPENLLFYDLMANGWSEDYVGFLRWINGWMEDSQVTCLDPKVGSSVIYLSRLDEIGGMKLLAIPMEVGKVVMAEFRKGSFDDGEGLLVYSFDQNTPPGHGQMRQVRFRNVVETLLINQQSGNLFGITFKVLDVDKDGMYVQIVNK